MLNMSFDLLVFFLGVLFISAALHEMTHAYVAYRLGDDLAHSQGRISLNPLVHIDPFLTILMPLVLLMLGAPPIIAAKPVPINTARISGEDWGLALVGVSGPLTNLLIAFLAGLAGNLFVTTGLTLEIIQMFVLVNVSLFVFNMLPFPPLDGSRLLYAVAPEPVQALMRQIESFGIFGLVIFISLTYPFLSPILGTMYDFVLDLVTHPII